VFAARVARRLGPGAIGWSGTGYRRDVLAIAALVPDTALLVPGAAGRAVLLEDVRSASVAAVRQLVLAAPDRVVVVAPGPIDRVLRGPVRATLAPAGIDDTELGWAVPGVAPGTGAAADVDGGVVTAALAASVALLLLGHCGWTGQATVVEVAAPRQDPRTGTARSADGDRAKALRTLGAELAAGPDRVALVVAGSLSARNGPYAPYPEDVRAGPLDAGVLADLACADREARQRLGAIPGALAAELVLTVWAPVQVLVGAAADVPTLEGAGWHLGAPFGVLYPVLTWRAPAAAGGGAATGSAGAVR
jgi:hypothetical protein